MVATRKKRKKRLEIYGRSEIRPFSVSLLPGVFFVFGFMLPKAAALSVTANPYDTLKAQIEGGPPQLKTFYNTTSPILWPCRFRFTEFTTENADTGEKCHFQMFGASQILGGRIALTNAEVHLLRTRDNKIVDKFGLRIEGVEKNGIFKYTERRRADFIYEPPVENSSSEELTFSSEMSGSGDGDDIGFDELDDDTEDDRYDWGPPMEIDNDEDDENVAFKTDDDNFVILGVPGCGTEVRFRAPNVDASQQDLSLGLSVEINHNGTVVFEDPQTYLAETDVEDYLDESATIHNLPLELEILHQTMETAARQYSTVLGTECEDTAQIYRLQCTSSSKEEAALTSCSYFLKNSNFVSCMDPSGDLITSNSLSVFRLCLWNKCSHSKSVCRMFKERVEIRGCTSLLPAEFSQMQC